jgi:hypothetical protein
MGHQQLAYTQGGSYSHGRALGAARTNGTNIHVAVKASQTAGPGSASIEAGKRGVDYGPVHAMMHGLAGG